MGKIGIDPRPRKGGHGHPALDVLPWAHSIFGNLETRLGGSFRGARPKPLQRDFDEFGDRFDRRWSENEFFRSVLRGVTRGHPLPHRRLAAEGSA